MSAPLVPITFEVGTDTQLQLEKLAAEEGLTVAVYMRSVAIGHVYEKLILRRQFEKAYELVDSTFVEDACGRN